MSCVRLLCSSFWETLQAQFFSTAFSSIFSPCAWYGLVWWNWARLIGRDHWLCAWREQNSVCSILHCSTICSPAASLSPWPWPTPVSTPRFCGNTALSADNTRSTAGHTRALSVCHKYLRVAIKSITDFVPLPSNTNLLWWQERRC